MDMERGLQRLDFLSGFWIADSEVYNLSDGSTAYKESYAMYNAWEPALENRWLLTHKNDHIEMFGFVPACERYVMWNMSSHRVQKVKKWTGAWEKDSLILYLQEKNVRTLPIRVHHDPSGAYIIMDAVLGSDAEKAGIVPGDLITEINGIPCTTDNQRTLLADLEKHYDVLRIRLLRKKSGTAEELDLPVGKKPQARLTISSEPEITWRYEIDERNDGQYLLKEKIILT